MASLLKQWIRPSSHIGVIELASSSNRNALSMSMLQQLYDSIQKYESDESVRVVLLQAQAQGTVFSSGHDLKEIQQFQQSPRDMQKLFHLCSETMVSIQNSRLPIVAKVDGMATAAGCQLVASCDLAYASTRSQFATSGINTGLFCSTPAVALSRSMANRKTIMELLLTGKFMEAEQAARVGLVNHAVHHDVLDQEVDEVLLEISSKPPMAIQTGKRAFMEQIKEPTLEMAYAIASKHMSDSARTDECIEGIDAFLNKREPNW